MIQCRGFQHGVRVAIVPRRTASLRRGCPSPRFACGAIAHLWRRQNRDGRKSMDENSAATWQTFYRKVCFRRLGMIVLVSTALDGHSSSGEDDIYVYMLRTVTETEMNGFRH